MYSRFGVVFLLIFTAARCFGLQPNAAFDSDKLREDIKKSFHKGYEAALADSKKANSNEKRYDIETLNQAARNRNPFLSSFGGDPYGMGSTMLSKQRLTFGRKKRSIVSKSKRYAGASQNALKEAYTSGYKAGKEMLAKIHRENTNTEKKFTIEKLNSAARHRNVYLDAVGGDPYGGSSVVASQQHINWNRGKRSVN
ncbi:uncharacterized protein LOC114520937 [Dendronephthya gigantea]|uniref:uncharacterized protein LOC114520937 n=1 Tax=Dendronephthya gigantea TaxID=151771 RepID=UPI00106CA6F5|nr:uncharacterized protein LOC114520937 [Dendronephthya gigantea]